MAAAEPALDHLAIGLDLFQRVDPGHDGRAHFRTVQREQIHAGWEADQAREAAGVDEIAPDRQVEHRVHVAEQPPIVGDRFHEFLALGGIGAVVIAGDAGITRPGATGHRAQHGAAEGFQVGIGALAVDDAHVLAGQQPVEDQARFHGK